jgi:hypothetical protein
LIFGSLGRFVLILFYKSKGTYDRIYIVFEKVFRQMAKILQKQKEKNAAFGEDLKKSY